MCPTTERSICFLDGGELLERVKQVKIADRILPAGSSLYFQGEPCAEIYVLVDGWLTLQRIQESGHRQILEFILPGTFFGYQPDCMEPMLHGAECLTDVALCVFSRRRFAALMERYPDLAVQLAKLNSRDAFTAQDHLTNVASRSSMARVAHLLLELSSRIHSKSSLLKGKICELPITQQHIADSLGLTSVYVSQMLKQMRLKRLLDFKNGELRILDSGGLAKIVDLYEVIGVRV